MIWRFRGGGGIINSSFCKKINWKELSRHVLL